MPETINITFDTADTPVAVTYSIDNEITVSGGGAKSFYTGASGAALISASTTGVTVAKTPASGLIEITIPSGVFLYSVHLTGTSSDADDNENLYVKMVYESESTINQSIATAVSPTLNIFDTTVPEVNNSGTLSRTYAGTKENKRWSLTKSEANGSDAELEIKVEQLNFTNWKIDLIL